jgi:Nucleotidyl transferase AbiEii toxin, Type IV TA system
VTEMRYASPQALRQAVRDRLREIAAGRPNARPNDLPRQFAYDRLLARVFIADPDRWVLKGATAMLARLPAAARHSKDIDLYSRHGDRAEAAESLREAARLDIGDYFRFTLGPARALAQGARATRVRVVAYLGLTEFSSFHADLVTGLSMTGEPEEVPPLIDIDLGLPRPSYRAYPVADHIADKLCAMLETHPRATGEAAASTRYRDLVDLATFARTTEVVGQALAIALRSESVRRGLTLPGRLPDPPGPDWRAGYARSVRDAPDLPDRDLDAALATVRSLLDPVLAGERVRSWDPASLSWKT